MKTTKLISIAVCLLTCAGCQCQDNTVESEAELTPAEQDNMVELVTDLPPAKHDRTLKPHRKQGEPLLVPQGTKLLSRGIKVTSSDEYEPMFGELEMITDGNRETSDWVDDDEQYVVELSPFLQWVQLDLGKPHALYAILVWRFFLACPADHSPGIEYFRKWPRVYKDVVVQISNDPEFKKDVTTVFNNDHDNSSGLGEGKDDTFVETSEGQWINSKGAQGRYVRLYSRGYTCHYDEFTMAGEMNHYIEVEVHGK